MKLGSDAGLGLETKYCPLGEEIGLRAESEIAGYASLFGRADQGGDIVERGAYAASLKRLAGSGRRVKMLWQHDPSRPIGVWDRVVEDERGLYVSGRILTEVEAGREALALLGAGAIDGLSIGYRTVRAERSGAGRILREIDLWEVSVVTFPMLAEARVGDAGAAEDEAEMAQSIAQMFGEARAMLA